MEDPAPLSGSDGLAHVSVGGVTTTAVGGVVLEATVPVAVLVHPLLSVTVTVNVPACVYVVCCPLVPFDHTYVYGEVPFIAVADTPTEV